MSKPYVVAYPYLGMIEIDESLAKALMVAEKNGVPFVNDNGRSYSTKYLWLLPKEDTELRELSPKQMIEAGKIADWLLLPDHGLGWSEEAAVSYAKKLVLRVDPKELKRLNRWIGYDGNYPDAKRFLMEAKQLANVAEAPELPQSLMDKPSGNSSGERHS